jgi:uncharacterized damage-inducible protein DinB
VSARREGLVGEAIKQTKQVRKMTLSYVDGLSEAQLRWQPAAAANPILWILWHVAEVHDSVLWTLTGAPAAFPLGRSALSARGLADAVPGPADVRTYLDDAQARFLSRLETLPDEDLPRSFGDGVWKGTGAGLIALPARHETYHAGQIGYIRRLMGLPVDDRNDGNPYR